MTPRGSAGQYRQGAKNSPISGAVAAAPGKLVRLSACAMRSSVLWCWTLPH